MGGTPALTSDNTRTLESCELTTGGEYVRQLGAYIRISDDDRDPETGELTREGVTRQLRDCHLVAPELGGEIVKVYDDNDTTASDPFVVRKHFEQLLIDLQKGVIDGFVFYHADRVARQAYDAARVCQIYERNPKLVGRAHLGGTDLTTDEGRAMFVMQAVMGGMEASATRRRKRTANRHNAQDGKDHKGRPAWGWDTDGKLVQPFAELRAEGVRIIANGGTIPEVINYWYAKGIEGENGKPVLYKTAIERIVHPRNSQIKAYLPTEDRRENQNPWMPDHIVYDDKSGEMVRGDWERLIDDVTYWKAVHTLERRKKEAQDAGVTSPRPGRHTRMLSGLLRCGKCGTRMVVSARTIKRRSGESFKSPMYRCSTTNNGCGGISRSAAPVEEHIEALALAALRRIMGRTAPSTDKERTDIEAKESRLREIADEIQQIMDRRKPDAERRISATVAMDMIADLEQERGTLSYQVRELSVKVSEVQERTPDLLRQWKDFTTDRKRHEIGKLMKAVIVEPAPRGKHFDPETLDVAWLEAAA
ncbi:recombinase family protein [Streptomyces antibioticus]|uniref:recombinase family protein n=1 Tax=Streptomyces antibioticus TaxID=1890 RepID=UPI0033FAD961